MDDMINIITAIPKEAVSLRIECKIMNGNVIQILAADYSIADIHDMRQDFMDRVGDDDYNSEFQMTEKGQGIS